MVHAHGRGLRWTVRVDQARFGKDLKTQEKGSAPFKPSPKSHTTITGTTMNATIGKAEG
jgi:hypothetical protein